MQKRAWRLGIPRNLLALVLLFGGSCGIPAGSAEVESTLVPQNWLGAWQERGSVFLNIEPSRIVEHDGSKLIVRGVIRRAGNLLILRNQGLKEEWAVAQTDSILRIADEDGTVRTFRRLNQVPPQVRLEPLRLPLSHSLPPGRIQAIRAEIEARFQQEQEILQDPSRTKEFDRVRQENRAFLLHLLGEVGWIDRGRFGSRTSLQTIALAKHADDLPMMMSILPFAEKDFLQAGKSQMYAILYDAVQLDLGLRQRYGTQVQEDEAGQPFVLPLEDPDRVDEYLRELGLPSSKIYQAQISKAVFAGKPVQVRPEDGQ